MAELAPQSNPTDLVNGLNTLIKRNLALMSLYETDLLRSAEDREQRDGVAEFCDLHEQHAHLLGATVRMLGGAPTYAGSHPDESCLDKGVFGALQPELDVLDILYCEERKLEAEYLSTVESLKASPETVAAIHQALEEREPQMLWLQHVAQQVAV